MKKIALALAIFSLSAARSEAREPKAAVCGESLPLIAKKVLALNLDKASLAQVKIKATELNDFGYDANNNEITEWKISWGYPTGEMSGDTYTFILKLTTAPLEKLGRCGVRAVIHSDIVE